MQHQHQLHLQPPAPAPTPAPAQQTPLQKVIEAAKKEGKINLFSGGHAYESDKISKGIKDTFGVDIQVSIIPGSQTEVMSTVAMEIQSGTAPSFDVIEMANTNIQSALRPKGLIADIDFKSLFTKDMDPQMILPPPFAYPSPIGYVQTLAYNSAKVSAQDLPKTYKEVTDPKWSEKFGWMSYGIANAEVLYFLGMADDNGVQLIRDIVKNKPTLQSFDQMSTKLSMGELLFALIGSHEYNRIPLKDPNTPLKWAQLKDFCLVTENAYVVLKGSKNLNAATLLVLYFCTPVGRAYEASTGFTSYLDPTTTEYKMVDAAKKAGLPVIYSSRNKDYGEWLASPKCQELLQKVNLALKGQ